MSLSMAAILAHRHVGRYKGEDCRVSHRQLRTHTSPFVYWLRVARCLKPRPSEASTNYGDPCAFNFVTLPLSLCLLKANGTRIKEGKWGKEGKQKKESKGQERKTGQGRQTGQGRRRKPCSIHHCPCQAYLTFEGHLLSRPRPHCLWFFYNLWCICDEGDHHEDENDEKDKNDDPTCNINDNVGIVAALRIGRSAGHLFSCVAPVVIISL